MGVDMQSAKNIRSCNSAGIIIRNENGEYCLLDRRRGVQAWAAPAGHIDEGEDPRACVARECEEETGIRIEQSALQEVLHCDAHSPCGRGAEYHNWFVYDGGVVADDRIELRELEKHRGIGWFSPEEMRHLDMEPCWRAFFERLDIL
jgi:8-oxo-dGTP pyrophosphatase MutT (NUDIX family)